ncbi:signal peptidase I [Amycolatopsis viridis]|uniref:Signal peptidase I n=1 Tax=Amycolatopsis viridis TaxID=185678 RepID=A0ABX0SNP8_9PSEU|nr:signal peptidase I [Amycolatopsis viridis]
MTDPETPAAGEEHPGHEDGARPGKRARKKRSFWVELPILLVVALALAFVFQHFLGRVYTIPSRSMEATLHGCEGCYGDKVLVDKITFDFTSPAQGDVVVFKGPDGWVANEASTERSDNAVLRFLQNVGSPFGLAPPDEQDFVKRIIATGGQTVQCCDDRNRVLVDGKPLDEPYLHWENPARQWQDSFPPVRVPDGYVWVMGDNRNNSCDSRCEPHDGPRGVVPVDNIIGKVRLIVLPPSRWGTVH